MGRTVRKNYTPQLLAVWTGALLIAMAAKVEWPSPEMPFIVGALGLSFIYGGVFQPK